MCSRNSHHGNSLDRPFFATSSALFAACLALSDTESAYPRRPVRIVELRMDGSDVLSCREQRLDNVRANDIFGVRWADERVRPLVVEQVQWSSLSHVVVQWER